MELHDYLRVLRRRWRWMALVFVLCVGGAVTATNLTTPVYRATAQLFISTSPAQSSVADLAQGSSFTFRQVTTYADMVTAPGGARAGGEAAGSGRVTGGPGRPDQHVGSQ
ncbi:Wzz/FepE/Etk N-terminal domain-containing protein [Ornithinimicrobium sp. W1665]|uniref:Wzz/FepE/Etk N-terminal domain-containing protein n=1 Tax=Ornithinimicrobium sp. W1665 TaxID=3416666 RepID=UPI003D6A69A3